MQLRNIRQFCLPLHFKSLNSFQDLLNYSAHLYFFVAIFTEHVNLSAEFQSQVSQKVCGGKGRRYKVNWGGWLENA